MDVDIDEDIFSRTEHSLSVNDNPSYITCTIYMTAVAIRKGLCLLSTTDQSSERRSRRGRNEGTDYAAELLAR